MEWINIDPATPVFTATERMIIEKLNAGMSDNTIRCKMRLRFEDYRNIIFDIRRKESAIMGKLSEKDKQKIYELWKSGLTQQAIANKYGVTNQAIGQLIKKMNSVKDKPKQVEPAASEETLTRKESVPVGVITAVKDRLDFLRSTVCDNSKEITELIETNKRLNEEVDDLTKWLELNAEEQINEES